LENWTVEQRAEITAEMDRILADQRFNGSNRCVALLRHLVEHALLGNHERIKERTLGIEVFGREPDYDTSSDPIVRLTATQIRKRLERYYQDSESRGIVKIRLLAGSYLPQFIFENQVLSAADARTEGALDSVTAPESEVPHMESDQVPVRLGLGRKWVLWGAAVLVAFGVILAVGRSDLMRSTAYLVWKPLLNSSDELIVCVPDRNLLLNGNATIGANQRTETDSIAAEGVPSTANAADSLPRILSMDAGVAYRIGNRLSVFGQKSSFRPSSTVTLHDLMHRPIVLIGGFNNPWSLMVLSNLRYSLHSDPATGEKWIQDAKDPAKQEWKIAAWPKQEKVDYAVVTRFFDVETGGWVMVFSGLGPRGTEAAGSLFTAPSSVRLLPASLRGAKNFQVVLKTTVIDGNAGPPQVLAVHTW
jgi:hypothetical protein